MNRLDAYLVDLDGTLADTSEANYVAYAGALREIGITFSRAQFDSRAFGRNWRQFLPGILEEYGVTANPADIAARKLDLYRSAADKVSFNEALIFLLINKAPMVKCALVTSASSSNVSTVFAGRPELKDLFDCVVTGDDVTRHKPDPEGYFIAAKSLDVRAENCVVFEDSDIGLMAARAFGARVLRVAF